MPQTWIITDPKCRPFWYLFTEFPCHAFGRASSASYSRALGDAHGLRRRSLETLRRYEDNRAIHARRAAAAVDGLAACGR
jgi:hypothetical protein